MKRRRLAVLVLGVVAVLVVAGVVLARTLGGGAAEPASSGEALRLVPDDALVAVQVALDPEREPVADALETARRFPGFARLRDGLIARLAPPGLRADPREVRSFVGDEAVLALFAPTTATLGAAGSLLVVDLRDEARARRFVRRGARRSGPAQRYRGLRLERYGAVLAAFVEGKLLLGQADGLRRAIDLTRGSARARRLVDARLFQTAVEGQPAERVALAYASARGVTQLLAPAGGVLGAAGTLVQRPGLEAVSVALEAREPGARARLRSIGEPGGAPGFAPFRPSLAGEAPERVLAYLGVRGLDRAVTRLVATGSAGAAGLDTALRRLRRQLGLRATAEVQRDLVGLLAQETATTLVPASPAPVLTVTARARDADATRASIAKLTRSIRRLFPAVRDERVEVGDDVARRFRLGTTSILVAVVGERLVLSTAEAGIRAAQGDPGDGLAGTGRFEAVIPDREEGEVSALGFLDLSELLALGDRTGLDALPDFRRAKRDLERVAAVGVTTEPSREGDTTAEILLQIR